MVDAPIYGRIATMELFKPPLEKKHLLFIATERNAFCVLAYDSEKGELVTRAMGDLTDRIGRPAECGQIGIVDPECRVVGVHLYDGLFKCLPVDKTGQLREAFNVRLDELQIVDVKFLHGCDVPTICVLYQDTKEARHVKTYEIDLKTKDLVPGPWCQSDVEGGTSLIVPVPSPLGGALLLGETIIAYAGHERWRSGSGLGDAHSKGKGPASASASVAAHSQAGVGSPRASEKSLTVRAVATRAGPFTAHGAVDADGSRVLLSDSAGLLHLLVVSHDGARVKGLKLEVLGETSVASTISYLDNGVAFVGSAHGDSKLIRLRAEPIPVSKEDEEAEDEDSSLVRETTFVETLETFPNLGPIVDFAVVDLDRHGQGQVVTCSGVAKHGTVRVVRNGVGIKARAAVALPGIKGCWSLRDGEDSTRAGDADRARAHDRYLVVTFMRETRVFAVDDAADELGEGDFDGFALDEQTLWCGNVPGGFACQVTSSGVRLADASTGVKIVEWKPGDHGDDDATTREASSSDLGVAFVVAAGNSFGQLVVSTSSGALVFLSVGRGSGDGSAEDVQDVNDSDQSQKQKLIRIVSTCDPGGEVACLDCSPLDAAEPARACAVGLWSAEVRTFALPGLTSLSRAPLRRAAAGGAAAGRDGRIDDTEPHAGNDDSRGSIPRAVLLCAFERSRYLLVGLSDGGLFAFALASGSEGALDARDAPKTVSLGTRPVTLRAFRNANAQHVFACSDRPTVIYGNDGALTYANANVAEVSHACPFDCAAFPDSLALCSDADLTVGGVDAIQKLHVRTVRLGEQPRRIAHQPSSKTFAVLTQREDDGSASGDRCSHFVRLLDAETFETKDRFRLRRDENDGAVALCAFRGDPESYYAVGTAFAVPEEVEPSRGRILVFKVTDGKLVLVAEKEVKGAVYNLNAFQGKLLAGINSKVQLFRWARGETREGADDLDATSTRSSGPEVRHELISECSHHGHIVALYVQVRNDLVVVGDLMKSVSLLKYDAAASTLSEVARDFNPNWMTAVDALGDDAYLGAENSFNLFTLRKNPDASSDEERSRLDVVGEFHLGEFVNRFRGGSLVAQIPDDDEIETSNATLFGTVNGALGVIATLPQETFEFAVRIQNAMNEIVKGVGGFSHEQWRSFHNEHQTRPAKHFVDGDVVERFLDLKKEKMKLVADAVGVSIDELTRRVEALQRGTH